MTKLEWVDTGNVWVDCLIFSLVPIAIHLAVPDTLNFSLGTLALGILFSASIPVYRRERWERIKAQLREGGIGLFYKLRDRYETVIKFEKEVCMCVRTLKSSFIVAIVSFAIHQRAES